MSGSRHEDQSHSCPLHLSGPVTPPTNSTAKASAAVATAAAAREDAMAAATAARLAVEPEALASLAAITAEHAAADAAAKTADAARSARAARSVAATVAATAVAEAAARTVEAVQLQADELAAEVAIAAAEAAATVSSSITEGGDAEAARAALLVGATVVSAAAAKAEETARAAVLVARAVAAAAAAIAATTAAEASAMEDEVLDAALAVRETTAATAQQLATETLARAATIATATRASAVASERLREANLQLQRASRHDRTVALALQDAMLTQLPEPVDLQLAARYLTAAEQDQVGGDWYDALIQPTGTTTLVIGDVIGHDITAAAMMGQLRNILRALAWERNHPPSDVVGRLDRAMRDLGVDTMATLILVSVEPASPDRPDSVRTLRWTNAGHPAPILIHADGEAVLLEQASDLLLGVEAGAVRRDLQHSVPAGATLLLYTDGLVETREHSITTGQERLLAAARTYHQLEPGALLDAVIADMVGDRPADDVAVLAVRFQEPV
jgi:serine phosphatase RsbU (regulator of sigma subunit)